MKYFKYIVAVVVFLYLACKSSDRPRKTPEGKNSYFPEIHAHRGNSSRFPENTIPAFMSAVNQGADALELDVVISADDQVVVSHEPYMAASYMITPSGKSIPQNREKSYNIYEMDYDSIRKFDSGSKKDKKFPFRRRIRTYKPTLEEVFQKVENLISQKDRLPVKYNVEIKSTEADYGIYQPTPEEFVELVMKVIHEQKMEDQVIIQSFDPNILNFLNKEYPHMKTAFLVSKGELEENLDRLNFIPDIYSPDYKLIDRQLMRSAREKDLKVITWTVNKRKDIRRMMELKVDGIISDRPGRAYRMRERISF